MRTSLKLDRAIKLLLVIAMTVVLPPVFAQDESAPLNANVTNPVSFEREILPLLERRCNRCHHADEQQGGLDLTRLETIRRGGDELGKAIVPGEPDASPLIQVLTGNTEPAMPAEGDPLPAPEIDLLSRWIREGARDDTPQFSRQDVDFFEKEIRPVLSQRCFKCHAGEEAESGLRLTSRYSILAGGNRGAAVKLDSPAASLILSAIRHAGDLQMPKGGDRLTPTQILAFEKWIANGLAWPRHETVLAREKLFTISEADRNHWAFRPLPESLPTDWSIDATLHARHTTAGITPATEADRYRLLRRVTYDLIGYPPTPVEISAFINDESSDAFAKVVDRLLASSHFGWRWGRHWLDYTRNGANGQPNRGPSFDADRYAAWVTRCFNEDRPWDWFARVHMAGDLMEAPDGTDYSIDQALAAAVPLNGPRTFEEIATDTFVLMDKLDEGIEFMGRSLMGISLECARCHDHKFDPVSQRDYYALLGFFQSSSFGPVPAEVKSRSAAQAAVRKHRDLMLEQARLTGLIRQASIKLNVGGGGLTRKWIEERQAVLAPKEKRLLEIEYSILEAELKEAERTESQQLMEDIRVTLRERQAALRDFKPRHFYVVSIKELGYFIHGHKSELGLIKRATALGLKELLPEIIAQDEFWSDEMSRFRERQRFGGFVKTDPEVADLAKWDDRVIQIREELRTNSLQPWLTAASNELYVRCEGGLRRAEELKPFDEQAKADGIHLNSNNPLRALLAPPYIGDARLLQRGDVLYPMELVPRRTPQFFDSDVMEITGSGRLQLANWLTRGHSIQAALVARAVVNRTWQHLFGTALCRTPKELGRLGEKPELPELIDGLAARFIQNVWSMKSLIRAIVMSDAYRRSSVATPLAVEYDPHNRLFARQSVRRLESEPIMNTMAWLRHGVRFETPDERDAKLIGAPSYRQQFDGPTTDDIIDRRVASISASQSLFMMNSPGTSSVITSNHIRRLYGDGKGGLPDTLQPIYEVILQRPPSEAEYDFARQFVTRRRQQTGTENHADEIQEFIRLLICGNEIIYIE